MKIEDYHFYHGAALTQIAKHPRFTAINVVKGAERNSRLRSAFRINKNIGIYLKYCGEPKGSFKEYQFNFSLENIEELERLEKLIPKVFLALVCVQDKQICNLPITQFNYLTELRSEEIGYETEQTTIIATLPKGRGFQVYVNAPGVRKMKLGEAISIPRCDFPNGLFK